MTEHFKLGVNGAAGRMGQRIVALGAKDPAFKVAAALEWSGCPQLDRDAGEIAGMGPLGVPLTCDLPHKLDVIIDFSTPSGLMAVLPLCLLHKIPLVVATTGLTPEQRAQVLAASHEIPVLLSPSMSQAVNVGMKLVREASRLLKNVPEGVDVEIIERHHRYKEDSPSGTALHFGKIVAEEMGQTEHVHGREGRPGQRPPTEIGYHAVRVGDNVGEHTIVFGMLGETLEVTVRGQTRDSYAYGALAAAKFLVTQAAGLYSMSDVLGL